MQKEYDYLIKTVVVGFLNSGKSSLLLRYVDDKYYADYNPIGIDFKIKIVDIGGIKLKVQLWDTLSYARLTDISVSVYRKFSAVIIV
jgi:GTPase SAR1 family protein